MTPCPPRDALAGLLAQTLPPADEAAVLAHIDGCPACQLALEAATATADHPSAVATPPGDAFLRRLAARAPDWDSEVKTLDWSIGGGGGRRTGDGPPTLPGYEVVGDELGHGGMGVVYKAWQESLKRFVAVKVLDRRRAADAEAAARFRIEAETLAALQHPNIVQVYEVGEVGGGGGRAFFAMEYVEGGTLARRLAGLPQPPRHAAGLVEAIARAVHYAHLRGVLHRDLKPANILLAPPPAVTPADSRTRTTPYGVPKISDFGLAKHMAAGDGLTRTGAVLGTPEYMAPEQISGSSVGHGPGCDVYALGVLLYESLTGGPPFKGRDVFEVLDRVREKQPVPPRQVEPKVPRDLETVCLKALAKDPHRRYPSAEDMADDLARYQDGRPIHARRVSSAERAWMWVRRRPAAAALVAVSGVAVLALVGLAVGYAYNDELGSKNEALSVSNVMLGAAVADAAAARRQSEASGYSHRIALAAAEWAANNPRDAARHLADCPADRRGWEWYYLDRLCRSYLITAAGWDGAAAAVRFTADGRHVVAACGDGTARTWHAADGRADVVLAVARQAHAAAFRPDGRRVAAGGPGGSLTIKNVVTGETCWSVESAAVGMTDVVFAADGRTLATAAADGTIRVWDAETGTPTRQFWVPIVRRLAFSPDGTRLAAAGNSGTSVHVWNLTDPEAPPQDLVGLTADGEKIHQFYVGAVAFSPDGRRAAGACGDRFVRVWDAGTGAQLLLLPTADEPTCVAFSPNGTRLAAGGFDRVVRVWDVTADDPTAVVVAADGPIAGVAFSPDGGRLATAGTTGGVKIWAVAPVRSAAVLSIGEAVNSVAYVKDGSLVMTGDAGGAVRFWDAATGRAAAAGKARDPRLWTVVGRPGGREAVSLTRRGELEFWDPDTGGRVGAAAVAHDGPGKSGKTAARGVSYSPDGRLFATTGFDGNVHVWDADLRTILRTLPGVAAGECVTFSPDGSRLAAAGLLEDGRNGVLVWDTASWELVHTLGDYKQVIRCVAYNHDGTRLAAGGYDQVLVVWDATSGKPAATLSGTSSVIFALAFHPSGRLAAGGRDGTIAVWDVDAGFKLVTLSGHENEVYSMAFSRDGHRLASAGREGTVRIWDARPDTPDAAAEREAVATLDELSARPLPREEIEKVLRAAVWLRPAVRDRALALAARYP